MQEYTATLGRIAGMYEVFIDDFEVVARVGLCPHERLAPQRLLVSLRLQGKVPFLPTCLGDCLDYSAAHPLLAALAQRPHVALLETLADELVAFAFHHDPRVEVVDVTIAKPDFYPNARAVGVRRRMTRAEFMAETCPPANPRG